MGHLNIGERQWIFGSTLKTFELPGAARATLGPGAS